MNLIEKIKKFYYEDHLKQKEIAKIVGLSESTVGEIHNRTLVFLRAKIKEDNML